MDIDTLRAFFMWCTIINAALLVLSSIICAFARDWVYGVHSKWFPIPKETFNVVLYSFVGVFKMLVMIFNVTPYIALLVMG